ncbi:MAG TPA: hypothetical protein GX697_01820 [Firmicutes bacterium]|nr:hypothetical protein [Bacillota bacterium]
MRWIDLIFLAIIFTLLAIYYVFKQGVETRKVTFKKRGTGAAIKYLEEKGYSLCKEANRREIVMKNDGKTSSFQVNCDFSVKKGGKRYLVFVKSTDDPERVNTPALRNHLLLLHGVFKPRGILIVNPEADKVQKIEFKYRRDNLIYLPYLLAFFAAILTFLVILKTGGYL